MRGRKRTIGNDLRIVIVRFESTLPGNKIKKKKPPVQTEATNSRRRSSRRRSLRPLLSCNSYPVVSPRVGCQYTERFSPLLQGTDRTAVPAAAMQLARAWAAAAADSGTSAGYIKTAASAGRHSFVARSVRARRPSVDRCCVRVCLRLQRREYARV